MGAQYLQPKVTIRLASALKLNVLGLGGGAEGGQLNRNIQWVTMKNGQYSARLETSQLILALTGALYAIVLVRDETLL